MGPFWCHIEGGIGGSMWGFGPTYGVNCGVNHWGEEAGLQSDTRRMRWGHFGATLRVGLGVPCGVLGPLMGSIVGSTIGVRRPGYSRTPGG